MCYGFTCETGEEAHGKGGNNTTGMTATTVGSLVSNMAEVLELLAQSSEMAVTWTSYFSPHFSMLIWQLVEADVQLREAPAPSTAVALYRLAPNTKFQVTVTVPLEQL